MSDEQNKVDIEEEIGDAEAGGQNETDLDEPKVEPEDVVVLNNDEQVAAAKEEVAQIKEQMLRDQAETQNVRKRLQQDVERARKFALEKFAEDLLPVMDNLERAITSASDEDAVKPVVEGIELTLKSFTDTLAKYNVEKIDPHGEPFDPQLHQAMTMVPNPDLEPNSVMDVVQKGYSLNGRLIRPAMVVVSKAP